MVAKRTLPEQRNPEMAPANSPSYEMLVERRRLAQTNLQGKAGVKGLTSATKAENLGAFDYVHLQVPLPKDLSSSGVFNLKARTAYPESYYLMRRSSDGYISATGMFKAAFPFATEEEEAAEKNYQRTFENAHPELLAGSVWVAPEEALALSYEYGIGQWIEALLDPAPVEMAAKDRKKGPFSHPPPFDLAKATASPVILPPISALRPTRARSSRSASPSKIATPSRKMASPRKSRTTRAARAESVKAEEIVETAEVVTTSSSLQNAVENGATVSESVVSESVNGDVKEPENVRIEIQETVEQNADMEITTTNVKIDLPAEHPELPEPEDPTELIEEAKKIVEEAKKLEDGVSGSKSKRKAEEMSKDENEEVAEPSVERPAKLARTVSTTEQKLAKEQVTRKALVGLGVMAAIGSAIGYFAGLA